MKATNDEFNPLTEEELQAQRDSEELDRRIRRMVVRVQSGEADEEIAEDRRLEEEERAEAEEEERKERRKRSGLKWQIFSGSILTSRGLADNYRYFAAIAVMCFLSIVLTFLSLNASNEYRRKEHMVTTLHERSVVKDEQRYGLSSKSAIQERLLEHNIELVDLSKNSRLIEK